MNVKIIEASYSKYANNIVMENLYVGRINWKETKLVNPVPSSNLLR